VTKPIKCFIEWITDRCNTQVQTLWCNQYTPY